jgi:hypothetical protein
MAFFARFFGANSMRGVFMAQPLLRARDSENVSSEPERPRSAKKRRQRSKRP